MTELLDAKYLNESKYQRAVLTLKSAGVKDPTAEQIREIYIKLGGAIAGEPDTYLGVPQEMKARVAEVHEEIVVVKKGKGKK